MKDYLMDLGFDVWKSVINGYKEVFNPPVDQARKKSIEHNAKSMNSILNRIEKVEFIKVMHCELDKDTWYKIINIYQGYDKI